MNINDFESKEKDVTNVLGKIFEKQTELMIKYKEIEGLPSWPLNINTKENQIWIKDFMWRVTEELMEAYEALLKEDIPHYKEEMVDSLHFATELAILSGLNAKDFKNVDGVPVLSPFIIEENVKSKMFDSIYELGILGNLLRNKKWKQTEVLCDVNTYKENFINFYNNFLNMFLQSGFSSDDIYNYYFRKHQVNQFRQRSKY